MANAETVRNRYSEGGYAESTGGKRAAFALGCVELLDKELRSGAGG